MTRLSSDYSINVLIFATHVVLVVLLTRLSSVLDPFGLYFTFQSLFFGTEGTFAPWALLVKLLIPLISGAAIVAIAIAVAIGMRHRTLPRNADLSAQVGGFFAAILMSWPMIVHWDALAAREVADKYGAFVLIYCLYAIAFFYLSGIGAALALRLFERKRAPEGEKVSWRKVILEAGFATVTTAMATFFLSELGIS
jgi:hypothetical protein